MRKGVRNECCLWHPGKELAFWYSLSKYVNYRKVYYLDLAMIVLSSHDTFEEFSERQVYLARWLINRSQDHVHMGLQFGRWEHIQDEQSSTIYLEGPPQKTRPRGLLFITYLCSTAIDGLRLKCAVTLTSNKQTSVGMLSDIFGLWPSFQYVYRV